MRKFFREFKHRVMLKAAQRQAQPIVDQMRPQNDDEMDALREAIILRERQLFYGMVGRMLMEEANAAKLSDKDPFRFGALAMLQLQNDEDFVRAHEVRLHQARMRAVEIRS